MNILIFILVLGILIFVHELGHFLFAKLFKIRVDEFGFGYPPKMFQFGTFRGTQLTMNWIPFGGFVKIFGESDDGAELTEEQKKVSLIYKPRWQQFFVMFGGILFNVMFAWLLFSGLYMSGVTASVDSAPRNYTFDETRLLVSNVLDSAPAGDAGLLPGDELKEYYNQNDVVTVTDETITDVAAFINESGRTGQDVGFVVLRDTDLEIIVMTPEEGIVSEGSYAVGINLDRVGELKLPVHQALWYGAKNTVLFTGSIVEGFWQLISGQLSADNVSGPVGIIKQVGQANAVGISYLIGFTALLSLNLAVLNLVPFPALDGGRILVIAIEAIIRKRLKPPIVNWVNTIGFFVLILLMIVVTVNDVIKLF
ncbi:site-2 protease family protein [Patescibacteria group bacterium]|nr:site-2 protease family protein [Patescibacteria group bacterium]